MSEINLKEVENEFVRACSILEAILKLWDIEINSRGNKFNYEHQEVYRQALYMLNYNNYKGLLENGNEEVKELFFHDLAITLCLVIIKYETEKELFNQLDRKILQLNECRLWLNNNLSNEELSVELFMRSKVLERKEYYESSFYNAIGFLGFDYHREIYVYAKYLLADLQKEFKDYKKYCQTDFFLNDESIFDLVLIGQIHKVSNGLVFEDICPFKFYKELNFLTATNNLQQRKGQKNLLYYIIYLLYSSIEDDDLKGKWMYFILKKFDLSYKIYTKKYKEIKGDSVRPEANDFYKEINTLLGIKDN